MQKIYQIVPHVSIDTILHWSPVKKTSVSFGYAYVDEFIFIIK